MNFFCLRHLLLLLSLLLFSRLAIPADAFSLVGDWQVTNMVTRKKQAVVRIWQIKPNEWAAKIVKACIADKRLQADKIIMLEIKKLKINTTSPVTHVQWDGVYLNPYAPFSHDPSLLQPTQIERCRLLLSKDHKKLLVRTYHRLPLLGHLDVWTRIKK